MKDMQGSKDRKFALESYQERQAKKVTKERKVERKPRK